MARARVGRYPSFARGGVTPSWSGVILEGHAPEPGSWQANIQDLAKKGEPEPEGAALYRLPGAMVTVDGLWREAPPEDRNPYLPEGYYRRLIQGNEDDWIRRFVANESVFTLEGRSVFGDAYSDGLHTLPKDFEPDPCFPIQIAVDPDLYGSAIFFQCFDRGRVVAFDELQNDQAGIVAFAHLMVSHVTSLYPLCSVGECYTDPAASHRAVDGQSALDLLRIHTPYSWRQSPVPRNDVTLRLESVRHGLRTLGDGGKPLLRIAPRCTMLRAALAGRYRFKVSRVAGSEITSGQIVKDEYASHAEALSYGLIGGGFSQMVKGRTQHQRRRRARIAKGTGG